MSGGGGGTWCHPLPPPHATPLSLLRMCPHCHPRVPPGMGTQREGGAVMAGGATSLPSPKPPTYRPDPKPPPPPHSPPSPHLLQGAAPPGAPAQPAARAPIRAARPVVTAHVPPPTPQRRALLQPGQAAPPLQARPPLGVAGVALGAAVDVVGAAHGLGGDRGVSALTLQQWGCPCAFRGRGDD